MADLSQLMIPRNADTSLGDLAGAETLPFDNKFNTKLSPQMETLFRQWKAQNAPRDSGEDYDLRGAFSSGMKPGADGHWSDEFKKPNHPTFSNQSRYAPYGNPGTWAGQYDPVTKTYIPPANGPDTFTPGKKK